MAREEEQGSAADLDRCHAGAHAREIPDLLGRESSRVVFEILADIRTSHIEKTQDSKRAFGNDYRNWFFRQQVVNLLPPRSMN